MGSLPSHALSREPERARERERWRAMRQVQARESPREDTDIPNVNDTFEHVVAPLSPSLFLSRSLQVSPCGISLTSRSTVRSVETALPIPSGIAMSRRIARKRTRANGRTSERTDGRAATSLSLSGERASAVPREQNGTVRYGTVRYRGIGGPPHGVPALQIAKEKTKAGPGDARVSRDAPGKLPAVQIPSFPREPDLGVRLCGNHRQAGDVCRCVTDFFPP